MVVDRLLTIGEDSGGSCSSSSLVLMCWWFVPLILLVLASFDIASLDELLTYQTPVEHRLLSF